MHSVPAIALEAALRRGMVAVLVAGHLVWLPGARTLVYEPAFHAWAPWLGLIPVLLLWIGRARGLVTALLAVVLAIASIQVAREGSDAKALLPSLAVIAALAHLGFTFPRDRFSLDRWSALGRASLPALFVALRAPVKEAPEGSSLRLVRLCVGALLAITAWMSWLGPEMFEERASASLRAATAVALLLPLGRLLTLGARRPVILVLYDEKCHFCSRTLQWLRALDPAECWKLHSESDLPAELLDRTDLDRRDAMFTVEGARIERGYHAFRHLLTPYPWLAPLVGMMGWPAAVKVGEWAYAKVAAHRSEWFVCAVDETSRE